MSDLTKLPKWAQEYIHKIERERDSAINTLNAFCDEQTESAFIIEEWSCTGENTGPTTKTRYIQTNSILVRYRGVELAVRTRPFNDENKIIIQWNDAKRHGQHVAFVPTSFQSAELIAQENMR